MPEQPSDADLLRRIVADDSTSSRAFNQLFERYHKMFRRQLMNKFHLSQTTAEDICQDTFLKIFTKKDTILAATENGNPKSYLFKNT